MLYDKYFKPFPTIITPRITLRALKHSDAKDLFECCRQPEVSEFAEWEPHLSVSDTKSYISWVMSRYKKKQCAVWGIVEDKSQKLIGTCSYTYIDKNFKTAEIGYCISKDYWGKGYGTEVAGALLWHGFNIIGFQRIQARLIPENIRSKRVLEKIGMEYEGLLKKAIYCKGQPHDLMLYAITDDMYKNPSYPFSGVKCTLFSGKNY